MEWQGATELWRERRVRKDGNNAELNGARRADLSDASEPVQRGPADLGRQMRRGPLIHSGVGCARGPWDDLGAHAMANFGVDAAAIPGDSDADLV